MAYNTEKCTENSHEAFIENKNPPAEKKSQHNAARTTPFNFYYLLQVDGDPEFSLVAKSARKNGIKAEYTAAGWVYQRKEDAEKVAKRWSQGKRKIRAVRWYDLRLDIIWNGQKSEANLAKKEIRHEIKTCQLNKKKQAIDLQCHVCGLHPSWLYAEKLPEDMSDHDRKTHAYFKPLWDETFKEKEELDLRSSDLSREKEDIESSIDEQPPQNFQFLSINSLLQKQPRANWIIKSYMDIGSLGLLFGEPGSMKSFVALDMGLCIASGHEWHGAPIRNKGAVFYIAGEGFSGLSKRLRAWTLENNINPTHLAFFISNRSAQLLDKVSTDDVVKSIDNLQALHGKPILVIIDTLNRNFGPGDENSTGDMTSFINAIDTYIRTHYGCAVLIVHHSPLTDQGRPRGSTVLHGALDWEYKLVKRPGHVRELSVTKVKDHDQPPAISFEPVTIQLEGWVDDEDGSVMTSCVLRKTRSSPVDDTQKLPGAAKVL